MTEQLTIRGLRTLPNIEALGFDWKALKKLLRKYERIWTESREVDAEFRAAEQEVGELERRAIGEMTDSILSGEEIRAAAEALPTARERLEELRQRSVAYSGALERLHREIVSCTTEHRDTYSGEVRTKAAEQLAEVEAAAASLQQLMAGLQVLGSLAGWLENPKKSFSYAQPDAEMFAGILEEARASKALPQEKRPDHVAIQHPGHTAPKGPVPDWLAPALRR
jgi:DNA repair exonuclease SbcCD ATPase subunit